MSNVPLETVGDSMPTTNLFDAAAANLDFEK